MASILSKATSRDKGPTSPTNRIFNRQPLDEEDVAEVRGDEDAPSAIPKESKTRKRKGSLRKTALLGGKRLVAAGRERKGSLSLLSRPSSTRNAQAQSADEQEEDQANTAAVDTEDYAAQPAEDSNLPHIHPNGTLDSEYDQAIISSSSDSGVPEPPAVSAARLSLLTDPQQLAPTGSTTKTVVNELGSPVEAKSPTSQKSYTSTTDDDDVLTFSRPAKSFPSQSSGSIVNVSLSSTSSSFLEVDSASTRLQRASKRSSPLSRSNPMSAYPAADQEPHDYTETAYWGWLLLFVTWLTFTVGMGSCLGIWSWAWDVGEKPDAPKELEDDETLPIVGYYPALMVLTGVVAWIWITVAWVGMKYFRHAKIEV